MVALHRVCVYIHRPKTPVAPIGTNRRVPNRVSACMIEVAIVGAGPAGLCTAAALTRGSANPSAIQVFDHIQKFDVCGAGLALRSNGFAALNAIDSSLLQNIAALTYQPERVVMHSLDGTVVGKRDRSKDMASTASKDFMIGWSELRDALAAQVPSSSIHLNKRLSLVVQHQDSVTLHFADQSTVDAKVVVGADGCFSKVRQQTLQDGLPEYTNTTVWRARLKAKDLPSETHMLMGGGLIAIYYPIGMEGETVWTVSASKAHLEKAGLSVRHGPSRSQSSKENQSPAQHAQQHKQAQANTSEQDRATCVQSDDVSAKERCKRVWGDGCKLVAALIDATEESTILEHNMYVRHPDSLSQGHWGEGRVTLVGDAAHPVRPASGQGVNQALEDAVELAQAIKKGCLTPDSLRAYESSRIPRVQQIMAAEMVSGMRAYADCPEELPEALRPFKHATAIWNGTDAGAYIKWMVTDRHFEPLSAEQSLEVEQNTHASVNA